MRKLRFLAIVAMFGFAVMSFAQTPPTTDKLMSDAFAKATKEKKSVWVIFHASW